MINLERIRSAWHRRSLILTLGIREVTQRFRSSKLGLLWTIIQPLAIVTIFYFVFSVVFQNRWGAQDEPKGDFIIALFSGFLVFNLFFDTVSRSPTMVTGNVNYVKKLVFPIHLLPIIFSIGSIINFLCTLTVLLIMYSLIHMSYPHLSVLIIPVIVLPVYLVSLGVSWFISGIGVYFRDMNHAIPLILQALVFLSPVLYPLQRVPEGFVRQIMSLNPLAGPIEQARAAIMYGAWPDPMAVMMSLVIGLIFCLLGVLLFQRIRPGFSDVL